MCPITVAAALNILADVAESLLRFRGMMFGLHIALCTDSDCR